MVFFSSLVNCQVLDSTGQLLGQLKDLVFIDGDKLGDISHLVYSADGKRKKISWRLVKEIREDKGIRIVLSVPSSKLLFEGEQDSDLFLGDLLDRQVIDVNGLKVVRVNDVYIVKADGRLCVAGVDVGVKAMLRRIASPLAGIAHFKEHIIPWEFIEKLDPKVHAIRVKVQGSKVGDLHPADIAEIMEDLTYKDRMLIFNALDEDTAAAALVESGTKVRRDFVRGFKHHRIAALLNKVSAIDGAEVLSILSNEESDDIINLMAPEKTRRIKELLGYGEETIARIMRFNFITIPLEYTAEQTIDRLRQLAPKSEDAYYLYVIDPGQHLVGTLSLRDLVVSQPERLVSDIMNPDVIKVHLDMPREEATKMLIKYGLLALPVVDSEGTLKGIITAEKCLSGVASKLYKDLKPRASKRKK